MNQNLTILGLTALLLLASLSACQKPQNAPQIDPQQSASPQDSSSVREQKPATRTESPAVEDSEDATCVVERPKEVMACTMEYRPVCGCDGITYSNGCTARAAGVPRVTEGACDGSDVL